MAEPVDDVPKRSRSSTSTTVEPVAGMDALDGLPHRGVELRAVGQAVSARPR